MIEQGRCYVITFKDQLNWPVEVLVTNILRSETNRGYVCIMANTAPNAVHDCTNTYWDRGYTESRSCRVLDADIRAMNLQEIENFKTRLFMFGRKTNG